MVTKYGKCIRFHETDVRSTGRVSMGVIGMSLDGWTMKLWACSWIPRENVC